MPRNASRPARPRPTVHEVAALAGVSSATVSRVLNDSARVSPAARRAVEDAVAELGYVPNPAARSLVTRRTNTLALVVSEPETKLFTDPFFAALVHGIAAAIEDTDLQLVLLPAPGRRQHEKVLRFVRQGHVDGVMLLSIHTGDILPERLREAEVPAVRVGRPLPAQPMPFVNADNRGGAREATAHLLATGRRSVATVTGPQDMTVAVDRLDGYRDALAAEGLDPDARLVAGGDFTLEGGERAMRELLERAPELDGVFVASDLMAVGALLALRAAGRRVPQDVGVVGFDDAPVAATLDPPLTTVRQPVEAMSRAIVDLLLRRIEGLASEDEHVLCETTLIRRSSA